jgi:hypothetical protein
VTPPTTVRLPPSLRAEAESYAERVGCSLSGLVGVALRDYLDARRSVVASPSPVAVPAVEVSPSPAAAPRPAVAPKAVLSEPSRPTRVREQGFHDPCWCGSGKKFGKCHGAGKRQK